MFIVVVKYIYLRFNYTYFRWFSKTIFFVNEQEIVYKWVQDVLNPYAKEKTLKRDTTI